MRVAVIGSRTFDNYELLKDSVKILKYPCWSQGAKGADSQGERYGVENDIEIMIFKPDWKKYGREVRCKE